MEVSAAVFASLPAMGTTPVSIDSNPLEVAAQLLAENSVRATLSRGRVVTLDEVWRQRDDVANAVKSVNNGGSLISSLTSSGSSNSSSSNSNNNLLNGSGVLYRRACEAPGYAEREAEFKKKRDMLTKAVRRRKLDIRRQHAELYDKYSAAKHVWEDEHNEEGSGDESNSNHHKSQPEHNYGHPGVAARRARDRTAHLDGIVRSDYEQEMVSVLTMIHLYIRIFFKAFK
jgi:hypothetical protein